MLVVLGATGMGSAVRFIPRPVVVGFTNGIAVLIASTQIRDFFGLQHRRGARRFPAAARGARGRASARGRRSRRPSPSAALAIILVANRVSTRIPGRSSRWCVGTVAVARVRLAGRNDRHAIRRHSGGAADDSHPDVRPELIGGLIVPAMTVAMLGAIESLMSAMVADRMSGDRHDSNVELVAQGLANIASPLVGGLPATGAIARTATNIRSGAQTPVAGIVHALTLLVILLVAAPLARYIPLAVLAAILMVVAYNMGDWAEIPELLRLTRTDIAVWIVTFALTVFADLTVGRRRRHGLRGACCSSSASRTRRRCPR